MARIARKNLKVFADSATNNGVFGSFQAGNPTVTNDVETIQSLSAWGEGWNAATMTSKKLPPLQEFQAVQYVNSYQTAYILQEGVPEWDSSTAYYEGSWVKSNASGEWKLYQSLANNNSGNSVTDTSKWQSVSFGGGLEVGDVGIAPLGIDETENRRRYLNGQVISQTQFPAFTQRVKSAISTYPSLGTTEVFWQQEVSNSDLGQCGKFVVDNNAGTIRLPKVVNIQGLQTLSGNLGVRLEAGLPNITGSVGSFRVDAPTSSGAFTTTASTGIGDNSRGGVQIDFDASKSNAIYGGSNTVQSEAIQYPYFIQVATGGETNIDVSTEVQLSNPFFFGMYQWFQTDPNNASWLEANGGYNAKTVYPSYYDWLLSIYNDTGSITGFNVKDTTDTYTDYDFVLNLNDETFRLPTKVHGKTGDAVVGNGNGLGINDGNNDETTQLVAGNVGSGGGITTSITYGNSNPLSKGTVAPTNSKFGNTSSVLGISTNPEWSGIEVDTTDMSLYFYVGAVVQDADVINAAGIINEVASIKGDVSDLKANAMGAPDYSSGVSLSNISTFQQITEDGYIGYYGTGSGNWTDIGIVLSFDGISEDMNLSVANLYGTSAVYPVTKDIYVKGRNLSSLVFYPYRR